MISAYDLSSGNCGVSSSAFCNKDNASSIFSSLQNRSIDMFNLSVAYLLVTVEDAKLSSSTAGDDVDVISVESRETTTLRDDILLHVADDDDSVFRDAWVRLVGLVVTNASVLVETSSDITKTIHKTRRQRETIALV